MKLRLADKAAHDRVVELLKDSQTHLYEQRNTFFDGANKELSSQRTVLRVRWFNGEEKVVITVKGKMAVTDGIGRAQEDEDEVDVATARTFDGDPSAILAVDLPVIKSLKSCAAASTPVCFGTGATATFREPLGAAAAAAAAAAAIWRPFATCMP